MTAGFARRLAASGLDALPGLGLALFLAKVGVLPSAPLSPAVGWFWSDWLVKLWLDAPSSLAILLAAIVVAVSASFVVSELAGIGAASWLFGLRTVDQDGQPPHWGRYVLRFLATNLCFASLGLGFLWAFASRHRRTWADILSGTCVTREH